MNLAQINYCADVFRNLRDGDERMAREACCFAGVRFDVAKSVYAEFVAEGGMETKEPFVGFKEKMERAFWSLFHDVD